MANDKLRKVALGLEPASLVLKNARIVNVFNGEIEDGDIAIEDGIIAGIGDYDGIRETDLCYRYVAPGFIDGHVHIESSMLVPAEFAKIVMPWGTTTVIADPHEIANVCGLDGVKFMINSAKTVPLEVLIMMPSCVPTTTFETAGAVITSEEIMALKNEPDILGLGEMMNYPGVIDGDADVYRKLQAMADRPIDGHAPGVSGKKLTAYRLAGIVTDHESTTPAELEEKVRLGMYVHLREGSATLNVKTLLPCVTKDNCSRLLFCTDDKHPEDIRSEGHISFNINLALDHGMTPVDAIRMATLNIANCYNLRHHGAIAPGYLADLVVFDNLRRIDPVSVYKRGVLVAKDKEPLFNAPKLNDRKVLSTIMFHPDDIDLRLPLKSGKVYCIGLDRDNVTTKKLVEQVNVKNGYYVQDNSLDILKLAVIERHHYSGRVGIALVKGYGLQGGAIALSIAHDSHNLIVIGDSDDDMLMAAKTVKGINGGIVLVKNHQVFDYLRLEVAGLMTSQDYRHVEMKLARLKKEIRAMGVDSQVDDPFLSLAFLSLSVIPDLKCTDYGLFDVNSFSLIPMEVSEDD